MNFSIIYLEPISGNKAKVYTLKYVDKEISEFQSFVYKFQDSHSDVIKEILARINTISKRNGIQNSFFRRESPGSHNVFRLLETNELRIYCIMFANIILLFGSGGVKTFRTKKLSENPHLEKEVNNLMLIEDAIKRDIQAGKIILDSNGFSGNLNNIIS